MTALRHRLLLVAAACVTAAHGVSLSKGEGPRINYYGDELLQSQREVEVGDALPANTINMVQPAERKAGGSRTGRVPGPRMESHNREGHSPTSPTDDSVTVMTANIWGQEVAWEGGWILPIPNLEHRMSKLGKWFQSLGPSEVPDVLVLQEVFGPSAERLIQTMCSDQWNMFTINAVQATLCDETSPFDVVTPMQGYTMDHSETIPPGGVVVLLKKGLDLEWHEEATFATSKLNQNRGFTAVHFSKGLSKYTIIGTHMMRELDGIDKRVAQAKELRTYAEEVHKKGDRLVFVGDFGVAKQHYSGDEVSFLNESLGGVQDGDLVEKGFWLELDRAVRFSWDTASNHYVHHFTDKKKEGNQTYDRILAPIASSAYPTPTGMRYQNVPLKADQCFSSEVVPGHGVDDLTNHYAVFSQVCYASTGCPPVQAVSGHAGAFGRKPGNSPDCTPMVYGGPNTKPKTPLIRAVYETGKFYGMTNRDQLTF